jgi:ABC-type polar amino acid transport system ATPase subunit
VVANLFLGGEQLTGFARVLDEEAMEHKTLELLDSLGVTSLASVRARVGSLSGGQRQSVAIARAQFVWPWGPSAPERRASARTHRLLRTSVIARDAD